MLVIVFLLCYKRYYLFFFYYYFKHVMLVSYCKGPFLAVALCFLTFTQKQRYHLLCDLLGGDKSFLLFVQ